jgi:hypothetical protein
MSMPVFSRILVAGLVCAAGVLPSAAMAQAATADSPSTLQQFQHAGTCVVTLGFLGHCDKDAPPPKAEKKAVVTPAVEDTSTRHQFLHTGECVVTLGFLGHCDKDAPAPKAEKTAVQAAADDASTRRQFIHTGKCLVTFGFGGGCDNK